MTAPHASFGAISREKRVKERAYCIDQCRAFFDARGFTHVDTPTLVVCPGLDVHLDAFETNANAAAKYLITSPEYQMKRLLADGAQRIYQIVRAYRRGEVGSRHNPEFSILEFYRAHASVDAVMRDTEQLVARVTDGCVNLGARRIDTQPPFARMPIAEAFARFAGTDEDTMLHLATNDEDTFYKLYVDKVEPGIEKLDHAVFITDYPASQASLARKKPSDPRFCERFELYVAGVECCNGFGELTDANEQRARFVADQETRRARGLPVYPLDEKFLASLERGLPPCAGNAIGLDRLIALACGTTNIGDVIAFTSEEA